MKTLITLADYEGTYIRTETTIENINSNFNGCGYIKVDDVDGKSYLLTPKSILMAVSLPNMAESCEAKTNIK